MLISSVLILTNFSLLNVPDRMLRYRFCREDLSKFKFKQSQLRFKFSYQVQCLRLQSVKLAKSRTVWNHALWIERHTSFLASLILKMIALNLLLYLVPVSVKYLNSDISMFWAILTISSSVTSRSEASWDLWWYHISKRRVRLRPEPCGDTWAGSE